MKRQYNGLRALSFINRFAHLVYQIWYIVVLNLPTDRRYAQHSTHVLMLLFFICILIPQIWFVKLTIVPASLKLEIIIVPTSTPKSRSYSETLHTYSRLALYNKNLKIRATQFYEYTKIIYTCIYISLWMFIEGEIDILRIILFSFNVSENWYVCWVVVGLVIVAMTGSSFHMVLITITRYISIVHPLKYYLLVTHRVAVCGTVSAWMFALLVTVVMYWPNQHGM